MKTNINVVLVKLEIQEINVFYICEINIFYHIKICQWLYIYCFFMETFCKNTLLAGLFGKSLTTISYL